MDTENISMSVKYGIGNTIHFQPKGGVDPNRLTCINQGKKVAANFILEFEIWFTFYYKPRYMIMSTIILLLLFLNQVIKKKMYWHNPDALLLKHY